MTTAALDDDPPEWLEPEDLTDEELQVDVPLPDHIRLGWQRWWRQRRERWRHLPDDPLPTTAVVGPASVGTVVRAVRWRTGLSQRALAAAAGVATSAVDRLETGATDPRLSTVVAVLGVAGLHLAVVDDEGTQLAVPFDQDGRSDDGDRHLAAHRPQRPVRRRWPTGLGAHPFTPVHAMPAP